MISVTRLRRQLISLTGPRRPEDVVAWLGAVQAQEYDAARWGLGLRMPDGTTDASITRAFDEGRILRTHVMRPTWHFVTAGDIRWMLDLTAPRVQLRMAPYNRHLELDARTRAKGLAVIEGALGDGGFLTRAELSHRLARARLPMKGQRLAHMVMHAELEGVICSGPRRGRHFTYALLATRAPQARTLDRDEALATLGRRFFTSHGPATVRDFVWWSGLVTADAHRALDMIGARADEVDGLRYWTCGAPCRGAARERGAHLLPIYDEYLVAYRDRQAVPHWPAPLAARTKETLAFQHAIVIDGQVAGTWRTVKTVQGARVGLTPLRRLSRVERAAVDEAIVRYERFAGANG